MSDVFLRQFNLPRPFYLLLDPTDNFEFVYQGLTFTARIVENAIVDWLERQCARGLIKLDDLQAASGMLRGMMILEPQRAVMLGQRAAPSADEITARAGACARLFLRGCRA